jgi:hypothetical protein
LPFGEKFYACSIPQPAHIKVTQQNRETHDEGGHGGPAHDLHIIVALLDLLSHDSMAAGRDPGGKPDLNREAAVAIGRGVREPADLIPISQQLDPLVIAEARASDRDDASGLGLSGDCQLRFPLSLDVRKQQGRQEEDEGEGEDPIPAA